MPEIKVKHVISFSSEDKIHKAENMVKPETYRKWKCASAGEKNATIVLQFEKACQIHSIDIGNESSAFVEVLVGRSSDSLNNFQVLLVASSFMSPLESRNETHTNRVRMFGSDKFSQQLVNEKWDCVQIVCTQPFNKNITYGLSFIKFHSPPEKNKQPEEPKTNDNAVKLGAFKLKNDEDNELSVGTWFEKKKESYHAQSPLTKASTSSASTALNPDAASKVTPQASSLKRKHEATEKISEPRAKKESQNIPMTNQNQRSSLPNSSNKDKMLSQKNDTKVLLKDKTNKKPFHQILDKVVFVLSGFVNPLRSQLRDRAVEMGAKYKADWDKTCTHLICAFINTPKYIQVKKEGGNIVSQDWINDSYKQRTRMPWMKYILGKLNDSSDDESDYKPNESESDSDEPESEDEPSVSEKVKKVHLKNGQLHRNENKANTSQKLENSPKKIRKKQASPKKDKMANKRNIEEDSDETDDESANKRTVDKDLSETDDETALEDYMADTDVESDSDCDTEDELKKFEEKRSKASTGNHDIKSKKDEYPTKADLADLPLPALPSFFKNRHFFLYGEFSDKKEHELHRYITAYNGIIESYMSDSVKYVITESKWDSNFEEALAENEDLIFVRSQWIFKCHELKKLVPYQPYIVIPES